eukprot:2550612-Ditylum_brightwellii.AAC.1
MRCILCGDVVIVIIKGIVIFYCTSEAIVCCGRLLQHIVLLFLRQSRAGGGWGSDAVADFCLAVVYSVAK